jgi:hypothetical protein
MRPGSADTVAEQLIHNQRVFLRPYFIIRTNKRRIRLNPSEPRVRFPQIVVKGIATL